MKKEMIKRIKNWKQTIVSLFVVTYVILAYGSVVRAGSIQESIYVTGTKKLLKDGLTALQVIVAAGGVVMWVVWEIGKRVGEENEEGRYSKRQKGLILGIIVAETIGTFFNVILKYYGVTI